MIDERHAITDLTDLRCALAIVTLGIDIVPAGDLDLVKYYCSQARLILTRFNMRVATSTRTAHWDELPAHAKRHLRTILP